MSIADAVLYALPMDPEATHTAGWPLSDTWYCDPDDPLTHGYLLWDGPGAYGRGIFDMGQALEGNWLEHRRRAQREAREALAITPYFNHAWRNR